MERITVIHSARKTIGLELKPDGQLILRAPLGMEDAEIREFLKAKRPWIERHMQMLREELAESARMEPEPRLSMEDMKALAARALEVIPPRVKHYADILGVTYGRITIRNQTSRWGSCSGKGNLNFNCLLMLMPPEVADYTIVHELCHRKEMNHSAAFWAHVAAVMPDYQDKIKWVNEHGEAIMRRMRG